jgi:hypothetical protein
LRENVIDIRMDLRQFQITRSLNNRMGTGHGCRNFATQANIDWLKLPFAAIAMPSYGRRFTADWWKDTERRAAAQRVEQQSSLVVRA